MLRADDTITCGEEAVRFELILRCECDFTVASFKTDPCDVEGGNEPVQAWLPRKAGELRWRFARIEI